MFEGLDWWQALLWGFGAGLASNGVFLIPGLLNGCLDCLPRKRNNLLHHTFVFIGSGGAKVPPLLYYTLIYTAMTIDEKYTKLKSIFFKDFVVVAEELQLPRN